MSSVAEETPEPVASARRVVRPRKVLYSSEDTFTNAWLLSFSDLMTLMLAFFVLRFSLSQQIDLNIPHTATVAPGEIRSIASAGRIIGHVGDSHLAGSIFTPLFDIQEVEDGRLVRLGASSFAIGSDELSFAGATFVRAVAKDIQSGKGRVMVMGHTDSLPIHSGPFASNWDLSSARSLGVVRQLLDAGVPASRLFVSGYADTRPLVRADSPAARYLNRRVEILVMKR